MGAIRVILLVVFVIICVLSVLIIIVQDDGQSGMGGLLGGRGTAAFGSHSANILTKTTFVFVVLFFVCALSLALLNKKSRAAPSLAPVSEAVIEQASGNEASDSSWWKSEEKPVDALEEVEVSDAE